MEEKRGGGEMSGEKLKIVEAPGGRSYRRDLNGWHYLKLRGTPEELGYDHGWLLAHEIKAAVDKMAKLVYIQTGMEWDFFRAAALEMWSRHMESEYVEEMTAIAEGVNAVVGRDTFTYGDIMAWNGCEELTDYWFPTEAAEIYRKMGPQDDSKKTYKEFHIGSSDHCSAFIATGSYTKDHRIVVAHNTFTQFEMGDFVNVVLDLEPSRGNRVLMQAQPGYIHSMTDYYTTGAGLMITETTIGGFSAYDKKGVPEFMRIRRAAQYAEHFDDFVRIMWEGNNGGYANTWLVGDTKTNEIMRLELGLKFYKDDRKKDGYFAGFNAPLDPRIRNFECSNSGFTDVRRHQGARQVRIPQLMEEYKGRIDNGIARRILSDHYDVYVGRENPSSRTICSHYELDDRAFMSQIGRPVPFAPRGAVDGVTATAEDAKKMQFWGKFGSSCDIPFDAGKFFRQHPQFSYLREFIVDRPCRPWTLFPPENE